MIRAFSLSLFFIMANLKAYQNLDEIKKQMEKRLTGSSSSLTSELSTNLSQVVTIEYYKAPLTEVLKSLADSAGINMIFSADVLKDNQEITIKLERVTYDIAIESILETHKLGYRVHNNILKVDTVANIEAAANALVKSKEQLWSLQPTRVLTWTAKNTNADDLVSTASTLLKAYTADPRFSIQADKQSNKVIVEGIPEVVTKAATIFESLDSQLRRQIRIDARIVEASQAFSRNLGVTWGANLDMSGSNGLGSGIIFPNSIRADMGGAGAIGVERFQFGLGDKGGNGVTKISFGSLNGLVNLDALIHAYETDRSAQLISAPSILVNDQANAAISESTSIPALHTFNDSSGSFSIDTGINLDVTPHILGDKTVEMTINLSRTVPTGAINDSPGTTTHSANTQLLVKSGDTAVIGGLHSTARLKGNVKIPILGSMPIIGWLFRQSLKDFSRTELLVLLTPQVLGIGPGGASEVWDSTSETEELSNNLNMSNDANTLNNLSNQGGGGLEANTLLFNDSQEDFVPEKSEDLNEFTSSNDLNLDVLEGGSNLSSNDQQKTQNFANPLLNQPQEEDGDTLLL